MLKRFSTPTEKTRNKNVKHNYVGYSFIREFGTDVAGDQKKNWIEYASIRIDWLWVGNRGCQLTNSFFAKCTRFVSLDKLVNLQFEHVTEDRCEIFLRDDSCWSSEAGLLVGTSC